MKSLMRLGFGIVVCSLLLGCGGGGGGGSSAASGGNTGGSMTNPPPASPPQTLTVMGPITGFGSVILNGTRYDTSTTQVLVNGQTSTLSALRVGQVIRLEGRLEGARALAERIEYDARVIGPIQSLDTVRGELTVLGQRIRLAGGAAAAAIDDLGLGDLRVGMRVEISALPDIDGILEATFIAIHDADEDLLLLGVVENLDPDAMTFEIGDQLIDYRTARVIDTLGGELENGARVRVRGMLDADDVLIAEQIVVLGPSSLGDAGDQVDFHGIVTRFASSEDFDVNGHPVTASAATMFEGGTVDDLRLRSIVRVIGEIDADGTVVADTIVFKQLPDSAVAGLVEEVNPLRVLGVTVAVTDHTIYRDFTDADNDSFDAGDIVMGDYIKVIGVESPANSNELLAFAISRTQAFDHALAVGIVDETAQPNLSLLGIDVLTTSTTIFLGSPPTPLRSADAFFGEALGRIALAFGRFDNDVLTALAMTLLPDIRLPGPPSEEGQLVTRTFDLDGFDRVDISTAFEVSIEQADEFFVEVTIEEIAMDAVQVSVDDGVLIIALDTDQLDNVQLHPSVRITMPALVGAALHAAVVAQVSGFTGPSLELLAETSAIAHLRSLAFDRLTVSVAAASSVDALDSSFGALEASVRKASQLMLSEIAPIESATATVGEISKAELNIAEGGSLSGSAEALSEISYFGTNVIVDVNVDTTSRVTRLGPTLP